MRDENPVLHYLQSRWIHRRQESFARLAFPVGDGPGDDYTRFIAEAGAIATGSSTYEWLLEHDILATADKPKPWPYAQPTWIFTSRELPVIPQADIRFVRGHVRVVHEAMDEPGKYPGKGAPRNAERRRLGIKGRSLTP